MKPRLCLALLLGLLTGCGQPASSKPQVAGPVLVDVALAERSQETRTYVLNGRLEAYRTAEVRARVAGIVQQRTYMEGQDVAAGQLLFRIEPAPMQAALAAAEAELAMTQAASSAAEDVAQRTKQLVVSDAVSVQQYRRDFYAAKQARAQVQSADARVRTARLNLAYTEVTAPIAGRASRALVSEGALVSQDEGTPLTRIEQLDPIYVNFAQPVGEAMDLRRLQAGTSAPTLRLRLQDGSLYPLTGQLNFTSAGVDERTDTLALQAQFANPEHRLLPGMYVEVMLRLPNATPAVLIPQQALVRSPNGSYVLCLDNGRTRRVEVVADSLVGNRWRVTTGLQGGEQVILQAAALGDGQPVTVRSTVETTVPAARDGQS